MKSVQLSALKEYTVVYLGGVAYYVRNRVEYSLPSEFDASSGIVPAVVFNVGKQAVTVHELHEVFARFEAKDDVFSRAFTKRSVLLAQTRGPQEPTATLPETLQDFLRSQSSKLLFSTDTNYLPEGPYFLRGRSLHQAWRLYADESRAFVTSLTPADNDDDNDGNYKFQPLHAGAYSGMYGVVGVPSRLYFTPSSEKPLNGLRVSVKDNYHVAGAHTTLGSRSFTKLYGVQQQTSTIVQKLIDLGAVVVGKTKMGAYAGSEVPPEKCIDYFPPWNPRGDGYQGPSGSSSGAGSSAATYHWLDFAFGTDSTGSIRMPAASYGLWGLRTTWGSLSLEGIVSSIRPFDTIGMLARTPNHLRQVLSTCVGFPKRNWSKKLLYPTDWFPMSNPDQQKMVDRFVAAVEAVLDVKSTRISLEEEWSSSGPENLRNNSLEQFLDKSIYWPNYFDGYHSYDRFREQHREAFGQEPYASPFMTRRWGLADGITEEQRDQGLAEIEVYFEWISKYILPQESDVSPAPMMLLPLGRPGANYRDIVPKPGGEFSTSAYDPMDLCTILGLPQLVIPIGQNPYQSRVTGRIEYAPIVASLTGVRGSDMMLLDVAQAALEKAGWPINVLPGPNVFAVGENDMHSVTSPQNWRKL